MDLTTIKSLADSMHNALELAQSQQVSYRELMLAYAPSQLGYPFNHQNYQKLYQASIDETMSYQASRPHQSLDLAQYNFTQLVQSIDTIVNVDDLDTITNDLNRARLINERTA